MYTVSHLATITESSPSSSYLNVMPSTSASTIDVCSTITTDKPVLKRKIHLNDVESVPKRRGRPPKSDQQKEEDKRQRELLKNNNK